MSDALRPGEVDLETGATGAAVEEPAAEPAAAVEAAPAEEPAAAVEEPAADEPAPAAQPEPEKRKPTGAVGELMELRGAARELRSRLERYEQDPVLQRLTPEMRQAIAENRIVLAPPKTTADAERERLTKIAERLELRKADGTPDLDAANKVGAVIREAVQEETRPALERAQSVERMMYADKARGNVDAAVAAAKTNGWSDEAQAFVREQFEAAAAMNPAVLLDQGVAMEVWDATVGKLHRLGKIAPKAAEAPAKQAGRSAAAPIPPEPTGKRGPAAAHLTVSPAVAAVYRQNGMDPAKSFTAQKGTIDMSNGMELE